MITAPTSRTAYVTGMDRAVVIALGGAGCALSYDALQQMAVAIHVRGPLTYVFPLVIDGFIAFGVRALLVLREAPLRARLYVWTLFGVASAASIWANALHALRLNQVSRAAGELRLADTAVAALSTLAPLALAGAVHLYILIARGPVNDGPAADSVRPVSRTATADSSLATDTGPSTAGRASEDTDPRALRPGTASTGQRARDRRRAPDTEELLDIARAAVKAQDKLTRKVVAQAIRGQGIPLSNDKLTTLMTRLRLPVTTPDTD
jgi:hypothetical protein